MKETHLAYLDGNHLRRLQVDRWLYGSEEIGQRICEHKELIALRQRVLHLGEDQVQIRNSQQPQQLTHYDGEKNAILRVFRASSRSLCIFCFRRRTTDCVSPGR